MPSQSLSVIIEDASHSDHEFYRQHERFSAVQLDNIV
jgi:hypothetical protein